MMKGREGLSRNSLEVIVDCDTKQNINNQILPDKKEGKILITPKRRGLAEPEPEQLKNLVTKRI